MYVGMWVSIFIFKKPFIFYTLFFFILFIFVLLLCGY